MDKSLLLIESFLVYGLKNSGVGVHPILGAPHFSKVFNLLNKGEKERVYHMVCAKNYYMVQSADMSKPAGTGEMTLAIAARTGTTTTPATCARRTATMRAIPTLDGTTTTASAAAELQKEQTFICFSKRN